MHFSEGRHEIPTMLSKFHITREDKQSYLETLSTILSHGQVREMPLYMLAFFKLSPSH